MTDTLLILHVKGTEQTAALPKNVVRAGIAQGQISRSQLIWSPNDQTWKQVRELPHLLPSQKLAPSPMVRGTTGTLPKVIRASGTIPKVSLTQPTPRPSVKVSAGPKAVAVAVPTAAKVERAEIQSEVEEEQGIDFVKWVFFGLGAIIAGLIGVNLLLVEMPLSRGMKDTPFAHQTVYAHLGGFMQTNALVIHLPSSSEITPSNLVDFLGAVAKSTPAEPLDHGAFERVSLAHGLLGDYSIHGFDWKQFGDMTSEPASDRKAFLLAHLETKSGQPLDQPNPNLSDEQQQTQREQAWQAFVTNFTR